jgi:hypothetical protein
MGTRKKGGERTIRKILFRRLIYAFKNKKAEIDAPPPNIGVNHTITAAVIHHSGINVRPFLCRRRPFWSVLVPVWWAKCTRQCCWDCPIKAMAYTVPLAIEPRYTVCIARACTYISLEKGGELLLTWTCVCTMTNKAPIKSLDYTNPRNELSTDCPAAPHNETQCTSCSSSLPLSR